MTQRSPSPADRPESRRDTSRPPRARRSADGTPYPGSNGTPYPGAPLPARGGRDGTRSGRTARPARAPSATRPAAPTPATVWAAGPDPIDPAATWPVPIIEAITTAFSAPGARVLLAPWPAPSVDPTTAAAGTPGIATATTAEAELAAAHTAVERLGRAASLARVIPGGALPGLPSRPFWADFVTDSPPHATVPGRPAAGSDAPPAEVPAAAGSYAPERADLIIAALPVERSQDGSVDAVALAAADLLAFGGILAVYTHSDWYSDRLVDPSGPMVAAGQSADLLYLQHIVTLHTPIRDGRLERLPTTEQITAHAHAARRAAKRGLPAPHVRAHGDVHIFAQAQSPEPPPAGTASEPDAAPEDLR